MLVKGVVASRISWMKAASMWPVTTWLLAASLPTEYSVAVEVSKVSIRNAYTLSAGNGSAPPVSGSIPIEP